MHYEICLFLKFHPHSSPLSTVYETPGHKKSVPSGPGVVQRTKKDVLEEMAAVKGLTPSDAAKKSALLAELSNTTGTAPHKIKPNDADSQRSQNSSAKSRKPVTANNSGQSTPKKKRPTSQACCVM